ncbi:hypothetical protein LX36DRAFT_729571 [Colletotrichum falcatum]|nr:hypothetical protein LX36DRAFT_729571 [Colletotrichum falcatum]
MAAMVFETLCSILLICCFYLRVVSIVRLRYLHVGLGFILPYLLCSGVLMLILDLALVKWMTWNLLGVKMDAWVVA